MDFCRFCNSKDSKFDSNQQLVIEYYGRAASCDLLHTCNNPFCLSQHIKLYGKNDIILYRMFLLTTLENSIELHFVRA